MRETSASSSGMDSIKSGTRSMIVSIPEDEALLTEADIIRRNAVSQVREDERDMVSLLKQMPHQDLTMSKKKSTSASSSKKKSASGPGGAITDAEVQVQTLAAEQAAAASAAAAAADKAAEKARRDAEAAAAVERARAMMG